MIYIITWWWQYLNHVLGRVYQRTNCKSVLKNAIFQCCTLLAINLSVLSLIYLYYSCLPHYCLMLMVWSPTWECGWQQLLMQYVSNYIPSLHQQPEGMPCHDDKGSTVDKGILEFSFGFLTFEIYDAVKVLTTVTCFWSTSFISKGQK
jgi:hypothetical protein